MGFQIPARGLCLGGQAMGMDSFFDRALAEARRVGASDVHLKPGLPPMLRIAGELRKPVSDARGAPPPLTRDFLHSLAMSLMFVLDSGLEWGIYWFQWVAVGSTSPR